VCQVRLPANFLPVFRNASIPRIFDIQSFNFSYIQPSLRREHNMESLGCTPDYGAEDILAASDSSLHARLTMGVRIHGLTIQSR